jgi:dTDP-4-dehydrorhamnose 3,5-epimerase
MIEHTELPGVWTFTPKIFGDARGWFTESYSQKTLEPELGNLSFVQDNHSRSTQKGTVRGLHFQTPPAAQDKLVRVLKGSVLDVAVDIRHGSPMFGKHVAVTLDAKTGRQLFVPKGFAHGFITLEPDTEIFYKVTAYYSAEHDRGMLWSDPALRIDWGLAPELAVVSDKDKSLPRLADLPAYF